MTASFKALLATKAAGVGKNIWIDTFQPSRRQIIRCTCVSSPAQLEKFSLACFAVQALDLIHAQRDLNS